MNKLKQVKWCLVIYIAAFCFQPLAVSITPANSAESPHSSSNVNIVEEWIIDKISNGETADLQLLFDEKQRILSAEFLVRLLTEPLENKHGKPLKLHIANARIIEPIDLKNKTLPNEIHLTNFIFDDNVNLMGARSKKILSFEGSSFQRVNFNKATFESVLIFRRVEISGDFYGSGARFLDSKKGVFFDGMQVEGNTFFSNAEFSGGAIFDHSKFDLIFNLDNATLNGNASFINVNIGRDFSSKESKFTNQSGSVSFEGMKVGGDAIFEYAVFSGEAKFNNAEFGRKLIFSYAEFTNSDKVISYAGMKVKNQANFKNAIFRGKADFTRVNFAEYFIADQASFESWAFFAEMIVGGNMLMNKALFKEGVNFNDAYIKGYLMAQHALFDSEIYRPTFNGMKVGEGVSILQTIFKGNADFSNVKCNFFNAEAAEFQRYSTEAEILFEQMQANGDINFKKVKFSSNVNLNDITIGRDLNAQETQFNNQAEVSIRRANIGGSAIFDNAVFTGKVRVKNTIIGRNLSARNAKFYVEANAFFRRLNINGSANFDWAAIKGTFTFDNSVISRFFSANGAEFHREAIFAGIKIGYDASFDSSIFWDVAIFDGARIGLNFIGNNMLFKNPAAELRFEGMTVKEAVRFEDVTFAGEVSLKYSDFRDLIIRSAQKDHSFLIKRIDLTRAHIRRELVISDTSFETMTAVSLKVGGPATLKGLFIRDEADLTHSRFSDLTLENICLPQKEDSLVLDEVAYWSVASKPSSIQEKERCQKLGGKVIIGEEVEDSIKYDSSIYTGLEAFLKRKGSPDAADRVYIAHKDREMEEHDQPVVKGIYYLWAGVAGYGRKPWNTAGLSLFIILLGCVVFWKKSGMVPTDNKEDNTFRYNPLWYSIDLFMPFVDLHTANAWMPKRDRKAAPHWARIQRFIGLILVPIFLAAITGIIK